MNKMRVRKSIQTAAIALCCASAPIGAWAQGLQIEPLVIDVDAQDENTLVLAALPTASAAPQFDGTTGLASPAAIQRSGFPQPSLVLGRIEAGQEEAFGIETLLPATVENVRFSLDDIPARNTLREQDPDLFARLVNEGHVDPPEDQLNSVLQTELQRMNCYRSSIDGAWGPGSRRSVTEYFDELPSQSWPNQSASVELFRAILVFGDVRCEAPVAAAPRPAASNNAAARTPQRTTQSAPRRQAQPAPAPRRTAPQPTNKPKLSIGGSGVFR